MGKVGTSLDVQRGKPPATPKARGRVVLPALIAGAGEDAAKRFLEFFTAQIRNPNC
jgi:hypothetical protein